MVKEASTRRDHQVFIGNAWPDDLTQAQRYAVVAPLLERQILHASDMNGNPVQGLDAISQRYLLTPPSVVVLSERAWKEVTQPKPAPALQFGVNNGIVQVGDENSAVMSGNRTYDVQGIIEALRRDAPHLSAPDREQAESWSESLENDVLKGRTKSLATTLANVASVVTSAASIWTSTSRFFGP